MTIANLRVSNFRNLASVDLAPCHRGINLICGNNGSGKTSLLESIHYLAMGRSFRSSVAGRLIKHEVDKFSVFSQLLNESGSLLPVGVERDLSGFSRLRLSEKDLASVAEIASCFPIRVINSQSHQLFESGPVHRRKFMDWGLFYQSEQFLSCWRSFERVMKQRNAVLRERLPKRELLPWTDELIKHALLLDSMRREYIEFLAPIVKTIAHELIGLEDLIIEYNQGWPADQDLGDVFEENYPEEMRLGYTQYGPHRADLDISIDAIPVKHFLSRGQQKLLICAMILAQGILLENQANKRLIYLIDDLPSELDLLGRQKLISSLVKQQCQVFITAIESEELYGFIKDIPGVPVKVFHVEHGNVRESTVIASSRHCEAAFQAEAI